MSTLTIHVPRYPWHMTPAEIRSRIDLIQERLLKIAEEKDLSFTQLGKAMGVSRAQAHHLATGRSATSLDRLAGLARLMGHRVVLELLTEAEAVSFQKIREAVSGLDQDGVSLVVRFARLVATADPDQRSLWDGEFALRERLRAKKSSGGADTSTPTEDNKRKTSA